MGFLKPEIGGRTGIESLDYEHDRLLQSANALDGSFQSRDSAEPILDGLGLLYERTCAHFALEEKLMREQGYRGYAARKAQHEALIDSIRTIMDAFYGGACDRCDKSLGGCVQSWLQQHLRVDHGHLAGDQR